MPPIESVVFVFPVEAPDAGPGRLGRVDVGEPEPLMPLMESVVFLFPVDAPVSDCARAETGVCRTAVTASAAMSDAFTRASREIDDRT